MVGSIRIAFLPIFLTAISSLCAADDAQDQMLRERIDQLESQLAAADEAMALLEKEGETLRSENRKLKGEKEPEAAITQDPFGVGVVWVGDAKINGQIGKWAISITERNGNKLSGVIAAAGPAGGKLEIPVSGVAPASGNGLVTFESPLIGRAKSFMRGRLINGEIALAVSITGRLGEKAFGSANLSPAN